MAWGDNKNYDKNNTIVVFRNKKKQEGTRQPDYTGSVVINDIEYDIAMWIKESKGVIFSAGTIQPKSEKKAYALAHKDDPKPDPLKQQEAKAKDDEDLPF